MRRLRTDSGCAPSMGRPLRTCFARPVSFPKKRSCSYSRRSAWHAACGARGVGLRAMPKGMGSPPNPRVPVKAMGARVL